MADEMNFQATIQDFDFWINGNDEDGFAINYHYTDVPGPMSDWYTGEHKTYEEAKVAFEALKAGYNQRRADVQASNGMKVMMQDYVLEDRDVETLFAWIAQNVKGQTEEHDNDMWLPIIEFTDPNDAFHFRMRFPRRKSL